MKIITYINNKFSLLFAIILVIAGIFSFYRKYFDEDPGYASFLFVAITFSMYLIIKIWKNFTPKYAPKIIYWSTAHKWVRKIISGGSFSYYEYNPNPDKIGIFEPLTRFLNLMIAFLGISTSIANMLNFTPESPVESLYSMLVWSVLIFIVPIILTPIIPVIWAMEDLKLKAWNNKHSTNWRVSVKYKRRFNSFIAVGTVSAGLAMTSETNLDFMENIVNFALLLGDGFVLLIYPISILTLLYYIMFKGKVNTQVKDLINLPTAITNLKRINPLTGKEEEIDIIQQEKLVIEEKSEIDIGEDQEEKSLLSKAGDGIKNTTATIQYHTFGRISRGMRKRKLKKAKVNKPGSKIIEKGKKGGSATEGLWDNE
jgi:hypothetical protein